jgi:hypothetical protein
LGWGRRGEGWAAVKIEKNVVAELRVQAVAHGV